MYVYTYAVCSRASAGYVEEIKADVEEMKPFF